jgi:methionyl-tRNA formyltransferase
MRVFLTGQKSFAGAVFNALLSEGHHVVGVACPPHDSLVEVVGERSRVLQTTRLERSHIPALTELIVCAHNHAYISAEVREAAIHGAISYHPSLLPRHRGRDAVAWAVKMGDAITGGTVYWVDDGIDTGPIAAQKWCFIEPGMTASDLWRKQLFPIGVSLITDVVEDIGLGIAKREPQNEAVATFEPALNPPRLSRGAHA